MRIAKDSFEKLKGGIAGNHKAAEGTLQPCNHIDHRTRSPCAGGVLPCLSGQNVNVLLSNHFTFDDVSGLIKTRNDVSR